MARKKITVTGVTSFVGYHLARGLSDKGWDVLALTSRDCSQYDGIQRDRLSQLDGRVHWHTVDITDENRLKSFVEAQEPDYFIHHAGYATNYSSLDYDMDKAHRINVAPLYYLYNALSNIDIKGVIVTGSAAEYSNSDTECVETDVCLPSFPYGLSKLTETLTACQLSQKYGIPTRVARLYIPYGSLDAEEKLLSYVVRQLSKKKVIELSPCEQQRDFIYIDDVVNGYSRLLDNLKLGGAEIFNICSGRAISLKDVVFLIAKSLGVTSDLLKFGAKPLRKGETKIIVGSNAKAKLKLNWEPRSLNQGILDYLTAEKLI